MIKNRPAVAGDKLILVREGGKKILIPQKGERIEVIVDHRRVVELERTIWVLRRKWKVFLIPERVRMVEEVTFFYEQPDLPVKVHFWSKVIKLQKISLGSNFVVTEHHRVFKDVGNLLTGPFWLVCDDPPGWEKPDFLDKDE